MSRYDVTSANTARTVKYLIEPVTVAERNAALFGIFKGRGASYPHYGQLTSTPTANQELAQLRTSLVVRALTRYTVAVGVELADDSGATAGATANFGPALLLTFEVDEQGEFFNQAWTADTTVDKHGTGDITDTLGVGGMTTIKTKAGLQSLLDSLYSVSYDGGVTGPFGVLSAGGAIVLPNGMTTAGAPELDTAGGVTSGLTISYVGQ